jgi:hypothetical protein
MNNNDYQILKQKFNRRIIMASYSLVGIVAMILYNAIATIFRIPYDVQAIRIIIPDILFNYGFNAIKNGEISIGVTLIIAFALTLALLVLLIAYAFKHRRWAFGWAVFFAFADIPLLIIVKNWQSIIVHIICIAILIFGFKMCGSIVQLDKRMWSF